MKKILYLGIGGIILGVLFISQSFILMIFSSVIIFGIAALGLNILNGYTGQISIGHGAFMGVGAYTTALMSMSLHTPFILNLAVAIIIAGLLGFIIGLPALRLKGFYLAIATMAFGVAVQQLFAAGDFFGGHSGIYGIPKLIKSDFGMYIINLAFFLLLYFIADILINSPFGIKYKMVRDSEIAAKAYGIKLSKIKLNAFVVSAVYGGIAGALYAHTITYISPADFGLTNSINLLSMIIIGGIATLEGGLIGSVIITGLPFLFSRTAIPMSLLIGTLLIVFVLFFPKGLAYGIIVAYNKYLQIPFIAVRKRKMRKKKMEGEFISVKGKKIFYLRKGKGKPVLFIHGNTGSLLWFSKVMDIPGYETIAFDLVNFGRSDRIETSDIDTYAEYTKAFMEELGITEAIIAAHSLGGAVAMSLVFSNPHLVSKLILIDSCPIDGLHTPEESYPYIEMYKTNRSLFKKAIQAVVPTLKEEKFLNTLVDSGLLMNRDSFEGNARALDGIDFTKRAAGFKKPVLFIVGKKDFIITKEMAEKTIGYLNGEVMVIDHVGHSLPVEDPELFKETLINFDKKNE